MVKKWIGWTSFSESKIYLFKKTVGSQMVVVDAFRGVSLARLHTINTGLLLRGLWVHETICRRGPGMVEDTGLNQRK